MFIGVIVKNPNCLQCENPVCVLCVSRLWASCEVPFPLTDSRPSEPFKGFCFHCIMWEVWLFPVNNSVNWSVFLCFFFSLFRLFVCTFQDSIVGGEAIWSQRLQMCKYRDKWFKWFYFCIFLVIYWILLTFTWVCFSGVAQFKDVEFAERNKPHLQWWSDTFYMIQDHWTATSSAIKSNTLCAYWKLSYAGKTLTFLAKKCHSPSCLRDFMVRREWDWTNTMFGLWFPVIVNSHF